MQVANTNRVRTEWVRLRSIARARQSFIASKPRLGRIQLQVRRAFISSSGRPLQISDLLPRVYPRLTQFESWHRWSVRRLLYRKPQGIQYRYKG